MLIRNLILYFEAKADIAEQSPPLEDRGFRFSIFLFLTLIAACIFRQSSNQLLSRLQLRVKTILIGAIYEKSLRLSYQSSKKFSSGKILNLINVDIDKVTGFMNMLSRFICSPFLIIFSIKMIGDLIGYAVWGSFIVLLLVVGLQLYSYQYVSDYEDAMMTAGDHRIKVIREMLYGIFD